MTNTNNAASLIKLTKVSADYKLAAGETWLAQGRVNKKFPLRPYHHTVRTATDLTSTLPADLSTCRTAIARLWQLAAAALLKDRAAALTPGASISLPLSTTDMLLYIADIGLNKREAMSGEELDSFMLTDTFDALTQTYSWTPAQCAKARNAYRAYAAPAHRKAPDEAKLLLTRLAPMLELLTGDEDAEEAASITSIHAWLMAKLQRDVDQLNDDIVNTL